MNVGEAKNCGALVTLNRSSEFLMVSRYCISSGSLPGRDWLTKALGNEKEKDKDEEDKEEEKEEVEEKVEKRSEQVDDEQ